MTTIEGLINGALLPDYMIVIAGAGGNIGLVSILSEGLSLEPSATWTEANLLGKLSQSMSGLTASAAFVGRAVGVTGASGINVPATWLRWNGTDNPSFSLSLLFAYESSGPIIDVIKQLNYMTYPKSKSAFMFEAPMGYTSKDDPNGLVDVFIGEWFHATKLIPTVSSNSIEPIMGKGGKPVLVKATINFKSYQLLTVDEVNEWYL